LSKYNDRPSDVSIPENFTDEMLDLFNQMDSFVDLPVPNGINNSAVVAPGVPSEAGIIEQFPDWDEYLSLLASDNAFLSSVDMKSSMHREIVNM
jgi:hypothetical protein